MIKQQILQNFIIHKMKILFDKNLQQEKYHSQHQIMRMKYRQCCKTSKTIQFCEFTIKHTTTTYFLRHPSMGMPILKRRYLYLQIESLFISSFQYFYNTKTSNRNSHQSSEECTSCLYTSFYSLILFRILFRSRIFLSLCYRCSCSCTC